MGKKYEEVVQNDHDGDVNGDEVSQTRTKAQIQIQTTGQMEMEDETYELTALEPCNDMECDATAAGGEGRGPHSSQNGCSKKQRSQCGERCVTPEGTRLDTESEEMSSKSPTCCPCSGLSQGTEIIDSRLLRRW